MVRHGPVERGKPLQYLHDIDRGHRDKARETLIVRLMQAAGPLTSCRVRRGPRRVFPIRRLTKTWAPLKIAPTLALLYD